MDISSKARAGIEEVWQDKETRDHLNAIEARLEELCDIDSGSYAFRYPEDKEGGATWAGLEHINLKQVSDVVQGMSHILDGSTTGMGEHLEAKQEMMAEYRAEMRSYYNEYWCVNPKLNSFYNNLRTLVLPTLNNKRRFVKGSHDNRAKIYIG